MNLTIDYFSSAMAQEDFAALFAGGANVPGQQAVKFNRLLAEGLAACGANVNLCTLRPVNRSNCRKVYLPPQIRRAGEKLTYRYGAVWNLPVVKNLWQLAWAYCCVRRDAHRGKTAVVCDVLNATLALGAALGAKHARIPCIGIVTDLPELMVTGVKQSHVRLVERVMEDCTGFVLLTEAMNERVNPKGKPYVIIEGLCDARLPEKVRKPHGPAGKQCIYAGLLDARYGVKAMVEGFLRAAVPDARLHIYGGGPYAQELSEIARENNAVVYHGTVMNDEVVRAEQEADLLINPRPTHEEFTRYSFPSKNMEYMASGTAVLTTRLPGMPEEYCPYVYIADDETAEGFCETFRQVLSLDRETLDATGSRARGFVLNQKNNAVQSRKILELIGRM